MKYMLDGTNYIAFMYVTGEFHDFVRPLEFTI